MAGNEAYFSLVKEENPDTGAGKGELYDMPPGTGRDQKTFAVFYKKGKCMAVLDFIWGYPEENTGFIGLFIVAADGPGKGIGKKLFRHIRKAARENGLEKLALAAMPPMNLPGTFGKNRDFEQWIPGKRKPENCWLWSCKSLYRNAPEACGCRCFA